MAQELKAHCITTRSYNTCFCYDKDEVDTVLAEKDKEIAELKDKLRSLLEHDKKEIKEAK